MAKVLEDVAKDLGRRPERGTVAGVALALVRLAEELELELGP